MKILFLSVLFSSGVFAQAVTCDVEGVTQALVINRSASEVHIGILPSSTWNGRPKTYKILKIRESGDLIQGIHQGGAQPTIMEIFFSAKKLRIGTITYVGHISQMQFGTYQSFDLERCR